MGCKKRFFYTPLRFMEIGKSFVIEETEPKPVGRDACRDRREGELTEGQERLPWGTLTVRLKDKNKIDKYLTKLVDFGASVHTVSVFSFIPSSME